MLKVVSVLFKSNANYKANVRYIKILNDSDALGTKLQIFHYSVVSRFPEETWAEKKKTNQTKKKWAERRGVMLEFKKNMLSVGYLHSAKYLPHH